MRDPSVKPHTDVVSLTAEFLADVGRCLTFSGLNTLCLRTAAKLEIKAMAYHHLPHIGAGENVGVNVVCLGLPKELVERFEAASSIGIDPTIQLVMSGTKAQKWREIEYTSRLNDEEQAYLDYAASRVDDGINVPVFGPNGRNGYVSLGFKIGRSVIADSEIHLIQSCCQFAHLKYCDLLMQELPDPAKLSRREKEILSWVAQGKSNGVIADILGLSESSVITYLERAFRKLEVDNRVTAALRASSLGKLDHLK
ncbi:MAG: LuxR C-terminal-related transcriptional regulator [Parasphingorhabdus sp.]|uniref:helix-turn-helix transcriptional regulator n=1 Tax=Parasphingorhabdus sp. TaxID=2709688 RepID=UPI003001CF34